MTTRELTSQHTSSTWYSSMVLPLGFLATTTVLLYSCPIIPPHSTARSSASGKDTGRILISLIVRVASIYCMHTIKNTLKTHEDLAPQHRDGVHLGFL
jgi:hypothetical protein